MALFLIAGVGVISYLAGRGSGQGPVFQSEREAPPVAPQTPATLPAAVPPLSSLPPLKAEVPPPLTRMRQAEARRAAMVAKTEVVEQSAMPATRERRAPRAPEFQPSRRVLAARRALVQPQRVLHASRVVQLGEYPDRRQANAAHQRLVRVYPYLKTLPKSVEMSQPPSGNARAYRLQVKAHSPDHARILCQNLLSIGRGCAVLPGPS
ncbi:MAG TPA: hypothetical protein VNI79_08340 [Sphingomicrobium sp.]|nr:hypothetical protein [Sphingomicrobium sp.]